MGKIKLGETKKLTNERWLNLYETNFVKPDGKPGRWVFASRNRKADGTPNPRSDAVVIVPIVVREDGARLCMIQEYRVPIQDYEWHFPAGLVEKGESLQEAAERELREEAGLELVKVTEISPNLYSSTGLTDESAAMVFCTCRETGAKQQLDSTEEIQVHLLTFVEMMSIMDDPTKKMSAKTWPILRTFRQDGYFMMNKKNA